MRRRFVLFMVMLLLVGVIPAYAMAASVDEWSVRSPLPTRNDLHGVTYGNDMFVAVGDRGTIVTSGDGADWTNRTAASGTRVDLMGIAYGNGTFIAVGERGTIVTSGDDGASWTVRDSDTNNSLYAVAYGGNGLFVAVMQVRS